MSKPKILMLDIETVPATAYVWRLWGEQNVGLDQLIDPGRVICVAWQWFGEREVHFDAEWSYNRHRANWLTDLHTAMSEADAIITYNGDKFDLPKLHGEFAKLGMTPPAPAASIDLWKTVAKLGFVSSKLAFISPLLEIGNKVKHEGFELWLKVMAGDEKARAKMERYNKQDTRLLGRLYRKLRAYVKQHPWLHDTPPKACPACGSRKVQSRGVRRTKSFFIERRHCQGCGAWGDGKRVKAGSVKKKI